MNKLIDDLVWKAYRASENAETAARNAARAWEQVERAVNDDALTNQIAAVTKAAGYVYDSLVEVTDMAWRVQKRD